MSTSSFDLCRTCYGHGWVICRYEGNTPVLDTCQNCETGREVQRDLDLAELARAHVSPSPPREWVEFAIFLAAVIVLAFSLFALGVLPIARAAFGDFLRWVLS